MNNRKFASVCRLALALMLVPALAVAAVGPPPDGRGGKPPAEAIDACKGKKAGDEVAFELKSGEKVSGVCRDMRGELVAVPDREGRGGQGKSKEPPSPEKSDSGPLQEFFSKLGLSKDVEGKIRSILAEEEKKIEPLRRSSAEGEQRLRKVAEGERFDEAAVRAEAAALEKSRAELTVAYFRTWHRVRTLMTPEQRVKSREVAPLFEQIVLRGVNREG